MYRRIWMAILAVAFAGAFAACGSSTSQPAAAPTAAPAAVARTAAPAASQWPPRSRSRWADRRSRGKRCRRGTRTFTIVPEQTEASYEVQENS